jgi:hypothetical protein
MYRRGVKCVEAAAGGGQRMLWREVPVLKLDLF